MEVVKEVQKDLFAALGKPLLEVENVQTTVRKGKSSTTTTRGEINLFTLGLAALGVGATMWITGIGFVPKDVQKMVTTTHAGVGWHPATTEWVNHRQIVIPGYWDQPPYTESHLETRTALTLAERPRMVLPFVGGGGSNGTAAAPNAGSAVTGFVDLFFGLLGATRGQF